MAASKYIKAKSTKQFDNKNLSLGNSSLLRNKEKPVVTLACIVTQTATSTHMLMLIYHLCILVSSRGGKNVYIE